MCRHGFCDYTCGHVRLAADPCQLAIASQEPFYNFVGCPNYSQSRKEFPIKCGDKGGYYCQREPDGPRITRAEAFLESVDAEYQRLETLHQQNLATQAEWVRWAKQRNMTREDLMRYPGVDEQVKTYQETGNARFKLHVQQLRAVRVRDYAIAHASDEPHEVGRNLDGTTIYSIFPVGYGEEDDQWLIQDSATRNQAIQPGQQNYAPGVVPQGNMQYPLPRQAAVAHQGGQPPMFNQSQQPGSSTAPPHFLPQPVRPAPLNALIHAHNAQQEMRARDTQEYYGQRVRYNRARETQPAQTQQPDIAQSSSDPNATVSAPNDSPAAAATPKKNTPKTPVASKSPTPLRRSTRSAATRTIKYKESLSDAGDPNSREPSPVKSAANSDISSFKEGSLAKTESSSHSEIGDRKRRHSSEELKQEIEDLNKNDKKPTKSRASLTNRIADFQKRTGAKKGAKDSSSAGGKKPSRVGSQYAQNGGGRDQSTFAPSGVDGSQRPDQWQQLLLSRLSSDPRAVQTAGFDPAIPQPNGLNNPYQQRMSTNTTQSGVTGHGHAGNQQRLFSPGDGAQSQPVQGQHGRMLLPKPAAHQTMVPPRAPSAHGSHAGMFGDRSKVFTSSAGQNASSSAGVRGGWDAEAYLRAVTAQGMQRSSTSNGDKRGHQSSAQGNYTSANIHPTLPQLVQNITIPSYRGSVTIPASSTLLNRHPAQRSNPSVRTPYLPAPIQRSAGNPSVFQFEAIRTPDVPLSPFTHAEATRAFNNPPGMPPRSPAPATAAEGTTDPRKKPTPTSDEAAPANKVRLSLPGEESAPVWPAEWRQEQQRATIQTSQMDMGAEDPFTTTGTSVLGEMLNIDSPRAMETLNTGFFPATVGDFEPAAFPESDAYGFAGTSHSDPTPTDNGATHGAADVFMQAVEDAEDGLDAERAAGVLMGIVNGHGEDADAPAVASGDGDDEVEGEGVGGEVDDVDWGYLNEEIFEE